MIKNTINNKVYIGQSKNINQRKSGHKGDLNKNKHGNAHLQSSWNKYGQENFKFIIIEKCNENILNDREIYWIDYYNSCNNQSGYNKTTGGNSNFILSNERIQFLIDIQFKIPILQIDLNGFIIKKWHSCREASRILNISQACIWQCVNNNRRTYKNFIWIMEEKYNLSNFNVNNFINQNTQAIKIAQLNLKGNLIKIWNNSSEAHLIGLFDSSCIIKCCKHKSKSHKGYLWVYNNEYEENKNVSYEPVNNKKSIIQLDLDNNHIKLWESILEAERYFANKKTGNINRALKCKSKTAYGFKWQYIRL